MPPGSSASEAAGVVNLFQLSFDSPLDLDLMQADAFILAVLTFQARAPGISARSMSVLGLGDSAGDPLDATVQSASVEVVRSSVPEPATLLLLASGLGGMMIRRVTSTRR